MENILILMGATLGILVPALFVYVIDKGIEKTYFNNEQKKDLKRGLYALVGAWAVLVWTLSLNGNFSYQPGDTFPRVMIALVVPVIAGLIFLRNRNFQTILDHIPLEIIVGVQLFRFAGAAFLLVVYLGILPENFAIGGYGDILTGIFALITMKMLSAKNKNSKLFFWLFNITGLVDLSNVGILILSYCPIWNDGRPSSVPMTEFSLVMIPAVAAPVAMLLHIYSIRKVLKESFRQELPLVD